MLESAFTTSNPEQCTEQFTPRALEQIIQGLAEGKDPVKACEEGLNLDERTNADSIEVADLSVDGTGATATVTPDGGNFAGAEVGLALVEDDGWRIDQIEDVEIYDRKLYLDNQDDSAALQALGKTQLPPDTKKCVLRSLLTGPSIEELEKTLTGGDTPDYTDYVNDAIRTCVGGGSDLAAITLLTEQQLKNSGIEDKLATCVAATGIAALGDVTLEDLREDKKVKKRYEDALKEGASVCSRARSAQSRARRGSS